MKRRSPMLIFIAVLALVQGVLGVFRAFEWFNVGADLLGQGLLILPLVGVVAFARGGLVIVLAMLYRAVCRRHAPAEELGLVAGFNRCRDKRFACAQCHYSRRVCFTRGLLVDCADRHRRVSSVAGRTRGGQASQFVEWSVTRAGTARSDARLTP